MAVARRLATTAGMKPLANKVAVVTGAAGGLGGAVAMGLASRGATVVLSGRRLEALEATAARINDATKGLGPGRAAAVCSDVSSEGSAEALFGTVEQEWGPCDILVNSAGIMRGGPTVGISAEVFNQVMAVNVLGSFLCAREAFKHMIKNGGGRIINIGSIAAQTPRPNAAPYTTSKFAIQGLTRSLALDGRPHNIAVGVVHPGNILTDIWSKEQVERFRETEGVVEPEDVAACVLQMALLPLTANVLEMTVLPTQQPFVGRG